MMKELVRFGLAAVLALVVVLPGVITAQDDEWTCDKGPNDVLAAAEAAYDEANNLEDQARIDKLTEAYWLAAQGEVICVADAERFSEAQALRKRIEPRLRSVPGGALGLEPGTVELGDFGLNIVCAGEGSPTVIFENGLAVSAISSWENIQPAISTVTRTCRYDRRNIGASAAPGRLDRDAVRTTQDQVDDLVLLLETAEIEPPYVLVAHSFGGWNALFFADQNPTLVEGLILLEASFPEAERQWCEATSEICILDWQPGDSQNEEHLDFRASQEQVADITSVGDRPLTVLTANKRFRYWPEAGFELWRSLQPDLATFSTNSRHIILENSDHWVQGGNELNLVIEAILWVIDEVRAAEE